jgi:hypothetical protein
MSIDDYRFSDSIQIDVLLSILLCLELCLLLMNSCCPIFALVYYQWTTLDFQHLEVLVVFVRSAQEGACRGIC